MSLNAPTQLFFIISLVIAIIGLLAGLGLLTFLPISGFWLMTLAWIVLAAACLLKGV